MATVYLRPGRAAVYCADFENIHGIRRRRVPLGRIERLAEEAARHLKRSVEFARAGMPPPADLRRWMETQPAADLRRFERRGLIALEVAALNIPLRVHLDDWIADLSTRSTAPRHVRQSRQRVVDLIADGRFAYWPDATPERVKAALAKRAAESGAGARTFNSRLASFRAFANWCRKAGRLATDPTLGIEKKDEKADPRWIRRVLPPEGLVRLIEAALASEAVLWGLAVRPGKAGP